MISGTRSRRPRVLATFATAACLAASTVVTGTAAESANAGRETDLSWRDVPTGSTAQFRGLAPVSRQVAWVSGTEGTVLRTTDGGRHWQDVSPGGGTERLQFRDIEAWDAQHAVIMSIGTGRASRIYRTDDGGRTWKLGFKNRSKNAFYDCMGFWDRRHGLAMSDPVNGKFRILATNNGGRTWQLRDPAGMPAALDGEFGFAASGTCLVTARSHDAWLASGGGATARVFHTADRGRTWTVADTPMVSTDAGGIFSLAVRDRHSLVAVGGDFEKPDRRARTSAYSLDAGASWTAGGKLGGYRSGAAWLPGSLGVVAVGPTGTDVSWDGGVTWARVDRGSLDATECTASGVCWASGADGRVAVLRGLPGR